jgi:pyridoxine 5-phosphate synthase
MPLLGVNIDHVATVRQARRGALPDPVAAALLCENAGARSIVAHLREDRRHIQDKDVLLLKKSLKVRFNLEMSAAPEIVKIACRVCPHQATLVPERRQELTTEGGLDVVRNFKKLADVCKRLQGRGIEVSLFIDPVREQLDRSRKIASVVELHTGRYADASSAEMRRRELKVLREMTAYGRSLGLTVNAGHGLDYHNTRAVAMIPGMHELNIGHSIISHALTVGIERAVKEMIAIIRTRR